jgi:hypothetical protein
MTEKKRRLRALARRWLWSPFVLLPPVLLAVALWPRAVPNPPIFDVQVHYHAEVWRFVAVRDITEGLVRHNVIGALVSSVPNEGTDRLTRADRNRVYPLFTPMRTGADRVGWVSDPEIATFAEQALRAGTYHGIGEFNLFEPDVQTPVVRRLATIAAERGLLLSSRADAKTIKALFELEPRLRILWAPTNEPVETVEAMLYRYPSLWVNLALARRDVAPSGALDPAWRSVFLRYPNRFMVGTATQTSVTWYYFRYVLNDIRKWLAELPPDIAERIAFRNAQQLLQSAEPAAHAWHDLRTDPVWPLAVRSDAPGMWAARATQAEDVERGLPRRRATFLQGDLEFTRC